MSNVARGASGDSVGFRRTEPSAGTECWRRGDGGLKGKTDGERCRERERETNDKSVISSGQNIVSKLVKAAKYPSTKGEAEGGGCREGARIEPRQLLERKISAEGARVRVCLFCERVLVYTFYTLPPKLYPPCTRWSCCTPTNIYEAIIRVYSLRSSHVDYHVSSVLAGPSISMHSIRPAYPSRKIHSHPHD